MKYLVFFLFLSGVLSVKAQSDTLYVLYESLKPNYLIEVGKHKDDPDPRTDYPFDGGRHYYMPKRAGNFVNKLAFIFISYTPDWMDYQFEYEVTKSSILEGKDFKGFDWFARTNYDEILRVFSGREKVIYLVDKDQIKDDRAYLIRVYFNHTAVE